MPRRPTFAAVYQALTKVEDAIGELPHNLEEALIHAVLNELEDLEDWLKDISRVKSLPVTKKRRLEEHGYATPPQGQESEEEEEEMEEGQIVEKYLKWCAHSIYEECSCTEDYESE
jgi:hypothetical protein